MASRDVSVISCSELDTENDFYSLYHPKTVDTFPDYGVHYAPLQANDRPTSGSTCLPRTKRDLLIPTPSTSTISVVRFMLRVDINGNGDAIYTNISSSTPTQDVFDIPPVPRRSVRSSEVARSGDSGVGSSKSMSSREARLETFRHSPLSNASDLAQAGLFYLGPEDRVQCHYCKNVLRNWQPDDVPLDEHRKHFPECPYAAGVHPDAVQAGIVPSAVTRHHVAKVPAMAIESSRHSSFCSWPTHMHQRPEELAHAGFYYTGTADHVRCFHCGGVLHNWSRDDDAWQEHARWFPGCVYVQQVKGATFVKQVHANAQQRGEPSGSIRETNPDIASARALKARMDLPNVVMLISVMGLAHELVKRAIEQQLVRNGDDFESVVHLYDAAIALRDEQPPSSTGGTSVPTEAAGPATGGEDVHVAAGAGAEGAEEEKTKAPSLESPEDTTKQAEAAPPREHKDDDLSEKETEHVKELKESRLCRICLDAERNAVFLPCGHLAVCITCTFGCESCPICRQKIVSVIRVYSS